MRVVVTRAAEDAQATAARLVALGHEPVVVPLARIAPVEGAWDHGLARERPAALLVTSASAFAGLQDLDPAAARIPVFAVGERTAAAARQAGFAEVQAGRADAAGLARLVAATLPAGARLLYAAGQTRKPDLEAALAAAGFRLTVIETYRILPENRLPEQLHALLAKPSEAAALHYSRASSERFGLLARQAGLDNAFVALRHLCLSADVAMPLRAAGAPQVEVAGEPNEEALLALLAS